MFSRIREIHASERRFNQKITDLYATIADYSPDADETKDFFDTMQNMLLFAITCQTATEIIKSPSDKTKVNMRICTSWKNPAGRCGNLKKLLKRNETGFTEYTG